jgi:hypothetical protein
MVTVSGRRTVLQLVLSAIGWMTIAKTWIAMFQHAGERFRGTRRGVWAVNLTISFEAGWGVFDLLDNSLNPGFVIMFY